METIILFAPLVGALIAGFGWKIIGERTAQFLTTGLLFLAAFLSWIVFLTFDGPTEQIQILRFIESGSLSTDWSIRMDRMTAIMLIVVTSVSALVHLYSFGYMAHDENFSESEPYRARFFAYLSFFTFAMLMLVTADNLLQMFFGWEGVGVASYLLIGFYYKKPSANAAAIKAFVVNRIGDFAFLLGIFGLYFLTDSIKFDDIFAAAPEIAEMTITFLWTEWNAANLIAFLLFMGAMGQPAHMVAGRDGRSDACVGFDPRRDNGDSGCVPCLPDVTDYGVRAGSDDVRDLHRRHDCIFCRDRWLGANRYQTCDRVFNLLPAGLYVRGCGCWHVFGGDVPPVHACLL
jgi:NADH-quinone oxidoreductase subunit L